MAGCWCCLACWYPLSSSPHLPSHPCWCHLQQTKSSAWTVPMLWLLEEILVRHPTYVFISYSYYLWSRRNYQHVPHHGIVSRAKRFQRSYADFTQSFLLQHHRNFNVLSSEKVPNSNQGSKIPGWDCCCSQMVWSYLHLDDFSSSPSNRNWPCFRRPNSLQHCFHLLCCFHSAFGHHKQTPGIQKWKVPSM